MDKKYNIGIIGLGYVGKAVLNGFSKNNNVFTHDIKTLCTEKDLKSFLNQI